LSDSERWSHNLTLLRNQLPIRANCALAIVSIRRGAR
jgi:hypothetical protein